MKFKDYEKEFFLFLELERGFSEKTIMTYKREIIRYHLFIKKKKINYLRIDKSLILDFHESLSDSVGNRTFARILSTLKTFYKFLHNEGAIDDIVLNEIKSYRSPKFKKSIPTFLSIKQIKSIIKYFDYKNQEVVIPTSSNTLKSNYSLIQKQKLCLFLKEFHQKKCLIIHIRIDRQCLKQ